MHEMRKLMSCSGASSSSSSGDIKRGLWTCEEDQKLLAYIQHHGQGNWQSLPQKAGLQRNGKSCRLRWKNYLRPDIRRGNFSSVEDQTIIRLHALLGNRWSAIAAHLPMRTDNEIKNYWNIHLKKRLAKLGIDPVTHKPKAAANVLASADGGDPKNLLNLSHMAQWESARLQAEARFVSDSKSIHQHDINAINSADPTSDLECYYYSKPADHHKSSSASHDDQLPDFTGTEFAAPPQCLPLRRLWESLMMSKSLAAAVGGKDGGVGGAAATNVAQDHFVSFGNVNVGVSSCGFESPTLISTASVSSMVDISEEHQLLGQSGNEYYFGQCYY